MRGCDDRLAAADDSILRLGGQRRLTSLLYKSLSVFHDTSSRAVWLSVGTLRETIHPRGGTLQGVVIVARHDFLAARIRSL